MPETTPTQAPTAPVTPPPVAVEPNPDTAAAAAGTGGITPRP
jgi:hypothetical protein